MAQYVKATNFASKDALLSGDPNKIVKGAEIDDEFSSIQTAVNSKADTLSPTLTGTPLAPTATAGTVSTQVATTAFVDTAVSNGVAAAKVSPAFTGVPTAPTASFGTSSTQLATTAFVQTALQAVYPVGSVYISTVATNPATTFGFGTWAEFGAGKVLVGQDTGDASFDTLGETGGSKDAIVVAHTHTGSTASAGSHTHTFSGTTSSAGSHYHASPAPIDCAGQYPYGSVSGTAVSYFCDTNGTTASNMKTNTAGDHTHTYSGTTASNGSHTHTVSVASTGSSGTNANLQPYVVVKMWKRTA